MLARLLLWRLLGLGATLLGVAVLAWLLHGGLGAALRGAPAAPSALTSREPRPLGGSHPLGGPHPLGRPRPSLHSGGPRLPRGLRSPEGPHPRGGLPPSGGWPVASAVEGLAALTLTPAALLLGLRARARRRRRYVRLTVQAYRADRTSVEGVVSMYEALHKRLQQRWWRRLLAGQPSVALGGAPRARRRRDRERGARRQLSGGFGEGGGGGRAQRLPQQPLGAARRGSRPPG